MANTFDVATVRDSFLEALTTDEPGPKGLVMQSECQLNRQRRVKPEVRQSLKEASAWCGSGSESTRRHAPVTTPAFASPAARR